MSGGHSGLKFRNDSPSHVEGESHRRARRPCQVPGDHGRRVCVLGVGWSAENLSWRASRDVNRASATRPYAPPRGARAGLRHRRGPRCALALLLPSIVRAAGANRLPARVHASRANVQPERCPIAAHRSTFLMHPRSPAGARGRVRPAIPNLKPAPPGPRPIASAPPYRARLTFVASVDPASRSGWTRSSCRPRATPGAVAAGSAGEGGAPHHVLDRQRPRRPRVGGSSTPAWLAAPLVAFDSRS